MDLSNLKMKDFIEIEKLSGLSMAEWETPTVSLTMAMAFVTGKKNNPELKWSEVEEMTMEEMTALVEGKNPKAKNS